VDDVAFHWHRHPLAGRFTYALGGGRFGAPRGDHAHQGQDLSAAMGTPVVAPRGGTVEVVAYQAGAAGNYVVLDGEGEDADYVFMHLATGSVRVRRGQRVATGQRLASVGNTGYSTGPHLHFEIWRGGWSTGRPVDPLPDLRRWDAWS
ncbi:MAG: M23 family metallopeptidase, partial [Actinomycetota bacterium]|nr:M23 family metallopeptidase [Actinomycetota bacterium]